MYLQINTYAHTSTPTQSLENPSTWQANQHICDNRLKHKQEKNKEDKFKQINYSTLSLIRLTNTIAHTHSRRVCCYSRVSGRIRLKSVECLERERASFAKSIKIHHTHDTFITFWRGESHPAKGNQPTRRNTTTINQSIDHLSSSIDTLPSSKPHLASNCMPIEHAL